MIVKKIYELKRWEVSIDGKEFIAEETDAIDADNGGAEFKVIRRELGGAYVDPDEPIFKKVHEAVQEYEEHH